MKKSFYAILVTLLITSCYGQVKTEPTAILITHAAIIDVRSGKILEDQQVVIDSGKIKSISDSDENQTEFSEIIDANGKYLLPGLAEMHAHIPQPPSSSERIEDVLFLYLSNGVTTIRGMLGHPSHLELREKAKDGEILSPRIFTSSPSFNGNSVPTPEEAVEKVKTYQKDGYDFLKIHPGVRLDVFDAMVKTANEVKIPFAGHVPVDVGIRHALKSKYASIDHVDGFLEGLVAESENVNPNENGFFGYNFTPLADTVQIDELVQMAKDNEVWIVPTQSLFTKWFAPTDVDGMLALPEMKYMPQATLDDWKRRKIESTGQDSGFDTEQWKNFDAIRKQLIKKLSDNGHGMLLGSDAPQLFNVPGFSIHKEMRDMADAGMSNLEIIQSGTINPAIYFGMENTFGEVKVGFDADLILIDADPLQDLDALQEISGVMHRGKWLSKSQIDKELKEIAANAAKN